jgi:hypothetical protein
VVLDPHRWLELRRFRGLSESEAMSLLEIALGRRDWTAKRSVSASRLRGRRPRRTRSDRKMTAHVTGDPVIPDR